MVRNPAQHAPERAVCQAVGATQGEVSEAVERRRRRQRRGGLIAKGPPAKAQLQALQPGK